MDYNASLILSVKAANRVDTANIARQHSLYLHVIKIIQQNSNFDHWSFSVNTQRQILDQVISGSLPRGVYSLVMYSTFAAVRSCWLASKWLFWTWANIWQTHHFFPRVILLCLYREPKPKKPRRPHTTGPKTHQLKAPTPKTRSTQQPQTPNKHKWAKIRKKDKE